MKGAVGDARALGAMEGADGRIADTVLPQTAKQAIGMPSSSPLHPLHPPGIGMSLVDAADILTAMSEAWTLCAAPETTSVRARSRPRKRQTLFDISSSIAMQYGKS
jgi:hypothetical protein